jgi:hypothetical protein
MEMPIKFLKREAYEIPTSSEDLSILNSRRERINEEQPIHPPVKANNENNLVEEVLYEEYVEYIEKVHLLQEENNAMHMTETKYEDSLNLKKYILKSQSNQEFISFAQYKMFVDALQVHMHKKYDLRPRQKESIQDNQPQPKKSIPIHLKDKVKYLTDNPKDNEVVEPLKREK